MILKSLDVKSKAKKTVTIGAICVLQTLFYSAITSFNVLRSAAGLGPQSIRKRPMLSVSFDPSVGHSPINFSKLWFLN